MCGLGGWFAVGEPPDKALVWGLLRALEHRGGDATGIGQYSDAGGLEIIKQPVTASEFLQSWEYRRWRPLQSGILHTRQATQGTAFDNNNNHPVFSSAGAPTILAHNGTVRDAPAFTTPVSRAAVVDSAILAYHVSVGVQDGGWCEAAVRLQQRVAGCAAIAAMTHPRGEEVFLAASGSPLHLLLDEASGVLWWASTPAILASVQPTAYGLARPSPHRALVNEWGIVNHWGYLRGGDFSLAAEWEYRGWRQAKPRTPKPYKLPLFEEASDDDRN